MLRASPNDIMTNLFADAGATKTLWLKVATNSDGTSISENYTGRPISPTFHDSAAIKEELQRVCSAVGGSFDKIRFYGTGIGSPSIISKMATLLSEVFECPDIVVDNDLVGAAHAALGSDPGIACIMGTGSNSCHFDGEKIDRKVASLGFILDDEGGGVAFGRRLLSDYFKCLTPSDISQGMKQNFNLTAEETVERLYKQTSPNRWIASFMPYIIENLSHPYMQSLVRNQVARFLDREFSQYPDSQLQEEGIGFVGSVAWLLQDILKEELQRRGWKLRNISKYGLSNKA